MKNYKLLIIFTFLSYTLSGQARVGYGLYVQFESSTRPGEITVRCSGFGKTKGESNNKAIKNLLHTFLFIGISGSIYDQPVIADDGKYNHPAVINLLENQAEQYIIENLLLTTEQKRKGKDGVKGMLSHHKITINCAAIIRHLEKKGVIKKFGY